MAQEENKLGMNRTGKDMAPLLSKKMLEGTEDLTLPRCPPGSDEAIAENRIETMRDSDPVGSVPLPGTLKGAVKAGVQTLEGKNPKLLIDKLGERLAFERTGTRIYEALISKFEANEAELSGVVSFEKLEEIKNEEQRHFILVAEVMRKLGADPTAMTPSADITAVASTGIVQVVSDPRIGFVQSLDAILIAELTDNDCWSALIQLTKQAGLDDVTVDFEEAYRSEQDHLATVRNWIQRLQLGEAGGAKEKVA